MLCTQCTQQNNLPQKSIGKLFSTTKKGYVEDRRSLYEIRRFQMPMFRCGDHEDLMNGMFKTPSMTGLRVRSPYHKDIVAQPYSCHTKNMINKVFRHALTIPVYSPLQELCFVRTAISSSPRMERSMRGCLRVGRLQTTYRLQAPRSNRANHLIHQTLLNALR